MKQFTNDEIYNAFQEAMGRIEKLEKQMSCRHCWANVPNKDEIICHKCNLKKEVGPCLC